MHGSNNRLYKWPLCFIQISKPCLNFYTLVSWNPLRYPCFTITIASDFPCVVSATNYKQMTPLLYKGLLNPSPAYQIIAVPQSNPFRLPSSHYRSVYPCGKTIPMLEGVLSSPSTLSNICTKPYSPETSFCFPFAFIPGTFRRTLGQEAAQSADIGL